MISKVSSRPIGALSPRERKVRGVSDHLIEFYKEFSFYRPKMMDYVSGLAARYAAWTMPKHLQTNKALLSYALWLSVVWIIDGMVDSGRVQNLERLVKMFSKERPLEDPMNPFEELVSSAYSWYRDLVRPFKRKNPTAYKQVNRWLLKYLGCQQNRPASLKEYKKHRLQDGAMMCVIWQLMMYGGVAKPSSLRIFSHVSLIVSFHNDLLSFDRDRRQATPNLLQYLGEETPWLQFSKGVALVNKLYKRVSLEDAPLEVKEICRSVLDGSHSWALNEPRYKVGMTLLRCWEAEDKRGFDIALTTQEPTEGDPNSP